MTALNLIQFGKSLALLLKSEPVNNPTLKALWSTELKRHHHSQASFNKVLTTFQERLQSMQDLLLLQKKLPGQVRTISEENSMAVFSSQIQWHIDNLEQRNKILKLAVKNPNSVRVFVKNECEGQAS